MVVVALILNAAAMVLSLAGLLEPHHWSVRLLLWLTLLISSSMLLTTIWRTT